MPTYRVFKDDTLLLERKSPSKEEDRDSWMKAKASVLRKVDVAMISGAKSIMVEVQA